MRAGLPALLGLLIAGCAAGGAREPRLTNPVRQDAWRGGAEVEAPSHPLDGVFRLPLADDWRWSMPDVGTWAISRLELCDPVITASDVLIGHSRGPGIAQLDRMSGRLQRMIDTDGPVQAPPMALADGGWLIADTFGVVQRLDASLAVTWRYESGGEVFRAPVVDGDQALVALSADSVVAIDLATGAWRWTAHREVPRGSQDLAILGAPAPVRVGDDLVVGFSDGVVAGLDPETGRERWTAPVGRGGFPDVQAEVIEVGDIVVAAAFGGPMVGLDRRSHEVRWTVEDAGATSSMVEAGGWVYAADARGKVHAVDAETGEVQWTFEWRDAQFGPPVRAGGWILVGDVAGTLFALDRFDGSERWRYRPHDGGRLEGVAARPAVSGRQVVFPTAGGTVVSLVAPADGVDLSEEPAQRADRSLGG